MTIIQIFDSRNYLFKKIIVTLINAVVRLAIDMITITIEYSFAVDHVIRAKTFGARMTGLAGGKIISSRYIINMMESQIHSDVKLIEHRLTLL